MNIEYVCIIIKQQFPVEDPVDGSWGSLIAGGYGSAESTTSEVFSPQKGLARFVGTLAQARMGHTMCGDIFETMVCGGIQSKGRVVHCKGPRFT